MCIVQVKNDSTAYAMDMWRESDGEFGPIVDPHDITAPHAVEEREEDTTDDPAMKPPG
jgi:hypothetical protein